MKNGNTFEMCWVCLMVFRISHCAKPGDIHTPALVFVFLCTRYVNLVYYTDLMNLMLINILPVTKDAIMQVRLNANDLLWEPIHH